MQHGDKSTIKATIDQITIGSHFHTCCPWHYKDNQAKTYRCKIDYVNVLSSIVWILFNFNFHNDQREGTQQEGTMHAEGKRIRSWSLILAILGTKLLPLLVITKTVPTTTFHQALGESRTLQFSAQAMRRACYLKAMTSALTVTLGTHAQQSGSYVIYNSRPLRLSRSRKYEAAVVKNTTIQQWLQATIKLPEVHTLTLTEKGMANFCKFEKECHSYSFRIAHNKTAEQFPVDSL
jgi:hypothetical protein